MPSTPTTKSQVQAYRFMLRRMQSALVRRDPVMLHDPMRSHFRAIIVSICIAAIGAVGFLIWGLISPSPQVPDQDGSIIIGKQSGQVYVLFTDPDKKLVPTFNLASARLVLLARKGEGAAQGIPTGGTEGGATEPEVVDDEKLKDIPKGRLTGIPNGPDLLPSEGQLADPYWTTCDKQIIDENLEPEEGVSNAEVETTVIGGVSELGAELSEDEGVLAKGADGTTWLIYRTPATANFPNDSAVKAQVDVSDKEIRTALQISDLSVREMSTGLLNAIPAGQPLVPPSIPNVGDPAPGFDEDIVVGTVFEVQLAGSTRYGVVLPDGYQYVKKTTADLIRWNVSVTDTIVPIAPDVLGDLTEQNLIKEEDFPEDLPEVLLPNTVPVVCLGWRVDENNEEHTAVHVNRTDVPGVEKYADGTPRWVDIATPGADGIAIDHFYMPGGRAAVVRGVTSQDTFDSGPIYLISDRGIKYGIPDMQTLAALGLPSPGQAPQEIMKLLPDGALLSAERASRTYDSLEVANGEPADLSGGEGG